MDTKKAMETGVDLERGPPAYGDEKAEMRLYAAAASPPYTIGPNPYALPLDETLLPPDQPQPFSWWWLLSVICAILSVVWLVLVIYVSHYFVIGSVITIGVSLICWNRTP